MPRIVYIYISSERLYSNWWHKTGLWQRIRPYIEWHVIGLHDMSSKIQQCVSSSKPLVLCVVFCDIVFALTMMYANKWGISIRKFYADKEFKEQHSLPIDKSVGSPLMGKYVGNCNSFVSTRYLASVADICCSPQASPCWKPKLEKWAKHCIGLTSLSSQVLGIRLFHNLIMKVQGQDLSSRSHIEF